MTQRNMTPDDEKTIVGTNSVHVAVHIAYLMGCSPIILLGMDCSWEDSKLHFYDWTGGNPVVLPDDPLNAAHARPVVANGPDDHQQPDLEYWRRMARRNPHVPILNASGGCLEAFPRIQMSDLPTYSRMGKEQTDG